MTKQLLIASLCTYVPLRKVQHSTNLDLDLEAKWKGLQLR